VAKKSAKFGEKNVGHFYIVLRKKKFEIFFLQNDGNRSNLYNQKKFFLIINFKHLKIAIKDNCSNLFARSNLFAPTVY
jgi:hypothetical protein